MKRIVFLLVLFSVSVAAQQRYVSVAGGGNGTSAGSPWTLAEGLTNAVAGMTLNVAAGNYGSTPIVFSTSGAVGNPIIIKGYKTTANDIVTIDGQGSSFVYPGSVSATEMPLLEEARTDDNGVGTGLTITGNYVELHNFQIKYFRQGLITTGDNVVIKNVITEEQGNHNIAYRADTQGVTGFYQGWGILPEGDNVQIINCFVLNAGAEGIKFQNMTNCTANGNKVYADIGTGPNQLPTDGNPTDYYFLVGGNVTNSNFLNTTVYRTNGLAHFGHGIVAKSSDSFTASTGNVYDGFTITNTYLEMNFPNTQSWIARNGTIRAEAANNDARTGIRVANGASNGVFENIYLEKANIRFPDWDDGLSGDVDDTGNDCTFNNIVMRGDNVRSVVMFDAFGSTTQGTASSADNHTFNNCTFSDALFMFETNRKNSNIQFNNCSFTFIDNFETDNGGTSFPVNESYDTCNFYNNGFSDPTGTAITSFDPSYEQTEADALFYKLQSTSPLKNIGKTISGLTTDFTGGTYTNGVPIGAFDYFVTNGNNALTARQRSQKIILTF